MACILTFRRVCVSLNYLIAGTHWYQPINDRSSVYFTVCASHFLMGTIGTTYSMEGQGSYTRQHKERKCSRKIHGFFTHYKSHSSLHYLTRSSTATSHLSPALFDCQWSLMFFSNSNPNCFMPSPTCSGHFRKGNLLIVSLMSLTHFCKKEGRFWWTVCTSHVTLKDK